MRYTLKTCFLFLSLVSFSMAQMAQQAKLVASDAAADDDFGWSVSISGDYKIVGAPLDDDGGSASGSAYIFIRSGTSWSQQAKLTADDAAGGDYFGNSVSISGDYAVVGAMYDDDGGSNSGSAYIFIRSGTSWSQQAKLVASDAAFSDNFGESVSISGDYAVVGAQYDDDGGYNSGSAYIFIRSGTSWSQQAKLRADDAAAYDYFGNSVSISGDYAVVGAMYDDDGGSYSGSAYIFMRSGTSWSQQAKLVASDAASGDYFGESVSISGDYAVVGAQYEDNGGSAYIFMRSGTSWSQQAKLRADDAAGSDWFGESVSISGDYAVVGAYGNDDGGSNSGSAYIFIRSGTSWSQQAKLRADDAASDDYFGISVSISGDYAVVGAHGNDDGGSAYTFKIVAQQESKLTADDAAFGDNFGGSVSISGDYALVGAFHDDDGGYDSGSAYIFIRSGTTWSQQAKLTASDADFYDKFGISVSISGDYALVSASGNDDDGDRSGSAYIYVRSGTSWSEQAKLTASDAARYDWFGNSVSISGDYAVVGAYGNDDDGNRSGSAYIFVRSGTSWSEQAKLTASDAARYDWFGNSVSISGDYAMVGADTDDYFGSAYIFIRSGTSWSEQAKLRADDTALDDKFGKSVSIFGDYAVVGASGNDDGGSASGSAYIFVRSGTSWSEQAKLTASDADFADLFGNSVSISGDYAVVGAYGNDDGGSLSGSAYIYVRSGTSWNQQAKRTASDAASADWFGKSVSISGDYAVVGAYNNDDGGSLSGSAYIYGFAAPSDGWNPDGGDGVPPTITGVSLASDNGTLAVTMSEAVYNTNGGSGALEASDFAFALSGGTAALSAATPTSISALGNVYTLGIGLGGTPNGSEMLTVTPVANSIYDAAGNVAATFQSNNTVALNDKAAPTIAGVSLASDNGTLAVTMSEAIFNTNGGSGALEASDFFFALSGGTATLSAATPTSISASGNVYTLGIGLSGTPNGAETLTVNPASIAIFDASGNIAGTSQSNNTATLNDKVAPTIAGVSLASDNGTLAVTMSEAIFNTNGGSGALEASDFFFALSGGTATLSAATPTSISASGNVYTLGISLNAAPNGAETLIVTPIENAIYDAKGNVASTTQSNNTATLNDKMAPTIAGVSLASDNGTLAVTMSEAIFNTNGGSGALEASDFFFALSGGVATLSSATPTSISASGNVYTLGISLNAAPNGAETLIVTPIENAIYDAKGNVASTTQSNNTATLNDKMAATIAGVSLASDNGTLAVTMSEAVYNTNGGSGALEASDFVFALSGGTATLSAATPTSISASGNVYTLGIGLSGTPNGSETLTVNPASSAIFDASGNIAGTSQSNNTATLNEQTAPVISSVALAANNSTIAVSFSVAVYNTNGGSGALEASDFALTVTNDGTAALASSTPSSISVSGNTYTLGISFSTAASGGETLTVNPLENAIYDAAGNPAATSQSNNSAALNDVKAALVPTGLTATAGNGQVALEWIANSDSDLASYKFYGDTFAAPTTIIVSPSKTTTTFTHMNLVNDKTYFYRISAVDTSGNESEASSDVSATPFDDTPPSTWISGLGGSSRDEGGAISVDAEGNIYLAGYFGSTADFDPGSGTSNLISAGSYDIFLSKYNSLGGIIWAKRMGGTYSDHAKAVTIDGNANIYITGFISGDADFDGDGISDISSQGSSDIFFAKYDSSGTLIWANSMGGSDSDYGHDIALDGSGNVYITGYFNSAMDIDPSSGTTTLTSAGAADIFIAVYKNDGTFLRGFSLGGSDDDYAYSLDLDGSSNVYVTGNYSSTADFDPGSGSANLTAVGEYDIFVSKFDNAGSFVWAKSFGGSGSDYGQSIDVDAIGNAVISGYYSGTGDFDPGSGSASLTSSGGDDMVFIKLNNSGDLTFAKSLGGISTDRASAVTVDGLGSILLAGAYSSTVDFDPGSGTNNLTSGGSTDIFLGKYGSDGTFNWAKGLGGSSSDYGNAITVDGNRNVYATGFFQDSADLDGDGITDTDGTGNQEIFIIKYNATGEVDKTAPLITGVSLAADNSTIVVTFSERVYGTSSGGSALETSDFVFSLSGGAATLTDDTPTSILISGNTVTLGFSLAGTVSGGETLTVNPKRDSVYDGSGNVAAEDQSNNSVTLNDQAGPAITAMTISDDNSTVSVTLSETAYSNNGGSGNLEVNDFAFSLTGGVATLASPFPTTIFASGTTITLGLSVTGTAAGNEQLTVLPATNSLYDAIGNVASTTQTNNTAYLTDKTAPGTPTSLSANGDNQQVTLSWTVSSDLDVAKYYIYSGTSASPTTMTDSTVGRANASKLITGLTNGTPYYFRVSAVDSAGLESAKSADASATPSAGSIITVKTDGTGDYTTIQAAVDTAVYTDTIMVYPGTYGSVHLDSTTSVHMIGKEGAENTFLDGQGSGAVIHLTGGTSNISYISGFTIKGGGSAGVQADSNVTVTITNCIITDNTGGGLVADGGSNIAVSNTLINGNDRAFKSMGARLSFLNCTLSDQTKNALMGSGTKLATINTIMADRKVYRIGGKTDITVDLVYSLFVHGKDTFDAQSIDHFTWGAGNLYNQPYFVNPDTGDYSLKRWSPAIMSGAATTIVRGKTYTTPITDLAGNTRPHPAGTSPDMGAYESVVPNRAPIADSKVIDGTPGSADIDYSSSLTTLSAYWNRFENDTTITYEYALGWGNLNDITNWTSSGSDTAITITGLNLVNSITYYMSVRGTNTDGALSDTVRSDGVFIDNEKPVISLVSETATDVDWFAADMADTIVVTAIDNYSIKGYAFGYGSVPGITFSAWTLADTNTAALDITSLTEGELYYSNIRVKDLTGQVANGSSDGFRVDRTPPVAGTVEVAAGVDSVLVKWAGFSDALSGLKSYNYSLMQSGVAEPIIAPTNIGRVDSVKFKIQDLVLGTTYYVIMTAADTAGNHTDVWSDFVYDLIPGSPTIVTVSQASGTKLNIMNDQTITFTASEKISDYKLALQSSQNDTIKYESTGSDQSFDVTLLAPFTSGDTIKITVTELVDMAGLVTKDQTYYYIVGYLGDYDGDDEIGLSDLTTFVESWKANELSKELGPAVGRAPHFKPFLDGQYSIRDGMIFSRMWRWDKSGLGKLMAKLRTQHGAPLQHTVLGNHILIHPPEGTRGIDIHLEYPPAEIELSVPDEPMDKNGITLTYNDSEQGFLVINSAATSDRKKPIRINLKNLLNDKIPLSISYVFQDKKRKVLSAGASFIEALPIPNEFALRQNYPNPFNPVTEILYDLPTEQLVELFVYDLLGREVIQLVNTQMPAGYHRVTWYGRDTHGLPISAGIYFYQLRAGSFVHTQKMILIK